MALGGFSQCSLGAYGKLPITREYLRANCHAGAARRYRDWIDRGYDTVAIGQPASPSRWSVLCRFEGEADAIVGRLEHSSDGLRQFPFSCFVAARPEGQLPDLLPAAGALWRQLAAITRDLETQPDTESFKQHLAAAQVDPGAVEDGGAGHARLREFASRAFTEDGCGRALADFLWDARQDVMDLIRSPQGVRVLRFPKSPELDPVGQAATWLEFLRANVPDGPGVHGVWIPDDVNELYLLTGEPGIEEFRMFWTGSWKVGDEDGAATRSELGKVAFRREVEDMVENDASVLADLAGFKVI